MIFDSICRQSQNAGGPNSAVSWWMMACYAYYVEDDPILSDGLFDEICNTIKKNWRKITHEHKRFIDREMVGSGFYVKDYPDRVMGALRHLRNTQPEIGSDDLERTVPVNNGGGCTGRNHELDSLIRAASKQAGNKRSPTKTRQGRVVAKANSQGVPVRSRDALRVEEGVPARRARKRRQAKLETRTLAAPTKPKPGYFF